MWCRWWRRRATARSPLPGEFVPYQAVDVRAKVAGFVERVEVDRGSLVKEGQLLATLVAPELLAQRKEAEARVQAVRSSRAEAEAKLLSAQSTWERLKAASATPGAIAGNELMVAEKVRGSGARAGEGGGLVHRSGAKHRWPPSATWRHTCA